MSIHSIAQTLIEAGIEKNEANAIVKLLIEHFCNFKPIDMVFGKKLDSSKLSIVAEKAKYIAETRKPVQHITEWGYFMNQKFKVSPDVLIPRDETELLVRKVIQISNKNSLLKVLDIGTGSGCIPCMVAKETDVSVLAIDISPEALKIASQNVQKLALETKIKLRQSDLFSNIKPEEKFDIIVSNPPYIPENHQNKLQPEVLYEPKNALFTKDSKGVEFYEKIIEKASLFLNNNGFLAFELGQGQALDVKKLLENKGFKDIEIEKDLANIDRVISAHL